MKRTLAAIAIVLLTGCGTSEADLQAAYDEGYQAGLNAEPEAHPCAQAFSETFNAYGWERCLAIPDEYLSRDEARSLLSQLAARYSDWQALPKSLYPGTPANLWRLYCDGLDGADAAAVVAVDGTRYFCFGSATTSRGVIHEFVHHLVGLDVGHNREFRCAALAIYARQGLVTDAGALLNEC